MFKGVLRNFVFLMLAVGLLFGQAAKAPAQTDQNAVVITFKDGHQQTFSFSDITRIEFKTGAAQPSRSSSSFIGRWAVGTGLGGGTFYITLEPDGKATKSMGALRGKWSVNGDEARISWDDGWHDVIRRAGNHYEKVAYAPGKSYSDKPDNITTATNTEPL